MRPIGTIPTATLHQPWATLVAKKLKNMETRTSMRQFRGLKGRTIAIHAGLKFIDDAWEAMSRIDIGAALTAKERAAYWPRGAVVAVGRVGDVWLCTGDDTPGEKLSWTDASFRALIDTRQRVCIEIVKVHELLMPVVARGYQGVWNWTPPESVIEELAETGLLEGLGF